jgi:nicotinamide mononucleotide transporter
MQDVWNAFVQGLLQTTWLEAIAVVTGIASVWFSRKENILVYPVGLINTLIYIYLSAQGQLFGEAAVNFYYTVMSIYGWVLWTKKDDSKHVAIHVQFSDRKMWLNQILFFACCFVAVYVALSYLKNEFAPGAIPAADAFASATAFTGMWLMARKKVESWWWWIATNIASIPLYFVKGYVFTSVYYFILLILAIAGLVEWSKRGKRIGGLAN